MQKIGLIGGLSWVSTLEYYRRLNQLARDHRGGHASAEIVLESLDEGAFLAAQAGANGEAACLQLVSEAVGRVLASGAQTVALCANGIHRFTEAIEQTHGIRLVSIAQTAAEYAAKSGAERVGVLGVQKTMNGHFYPEALAQAGLVCVLPDQVSQSKLHRAIVEEMVLNRFLPQTRAEVAEMIGNMGVDTVILACTELPILFEMEGETADCGGIKLLSSTELHCRSIIRAANG